MPKILSLICVLFLSGNCFASYLAKVYESADIFFDAQQSVISESGIAAVRAFVQRTERNMPEYIVIFGHSAREERDSLALSQRRVTQTIELLMKLGVAPSRIYSEAKSDTQPLNSSASDSYKNRRVELESGGLPRQHSLYEGFAFLPSWKEPVRSSDSTLKVGIQTNRDLLAFARRIKEPDLKQLFLLKLSLHAVVVKDDVVLESLAQELEICSSMSDGLPNTYLYASLFGSDVARRALQKCNLEREIPSQQRVDVFRRVFCESSLGRTSLEYDQMVKELFIDKNWISDLSDALAVTLFACSMRTETTQWLFAQNLKLPRSTVDGFSLLQIAVVQGDIGSARLFLDAGANVREISSGGNTLLHYVHRIYSTHSFGLSYFISADKQKELWNLLIAKGADPEAINDRGQKPKAP
jgi:hypothetical protein